MTNDGNGLRAQKVAGSTTTVYVFSGSKVIAEYQNGAAPSSPTKEYIYSGGALLATVTSSTKTYHHQDHLSVRMSTDTSGNDIADQGHFPYGESWYMGSSGTKWQFTSYERDAESGNDYAQARYNVSRLGRFSSPDPISGSTADPQSLNRYSYVRNMPAMAIDPTGMISIINPCPPLASNFPDGGEDKGVGGFSQDLASDAEQWPQDGGHCYPQDTGGPLQSGGCVGVSIDGGNNGSFCSGTQSCPPVVVCSGGGGGGGGGTIDNGAPLPINPRPYNSVLMLPPLNPTPPQNPCVVTQELHGGNNAVDIRSQGGYGSSVPAPRYGTVTGGRDTGWPVPGPWDSRQPPPPGSTDFVSFLTASGYTIIYSHVQPTVAIGSQATQGTTIGTTDQTGRQTAAHVHVTVQNPTGGNMDPRVFFPDCLP